MSALILTITAVVATIALPALLIRLTGGTTVLYTNTRRAPEEGRRDPQKQTD